jgi:hypothetical protein
MAQKRKTSRRLTKLVADFQNENDTLIQAMRLFEVSSAEYERALQALVSAPSMTVSSTSNQEVIRDGSVLDGDEGRA